MFEEGKPRLALDRWMKDGYEETRVEPTVVLK